MLTLHVSLQKMAEYTVNYKIVKTGSLSNSGTAQKERKRYCVIFLESIHESKSLKLTGKTHLPFSVFLLRSLYPLKFLTFLCPFGVAFYY